MQCYSLDQQVIWSIIMQSREYTDVTRDMQEWHFSVKHILIMWMF